jgi:hypothetical protein
MCCGFASLAGVARADCASDCEANHAWYSPRRAACKAGCLADSAKEWATRKVESTTEWAKEKADAARSAASEIKEKVVEKVEAAKETVKETARKATETVKSGVQSVKRWTAQKVYDARKKWEDAKAWTERKLAAARAKAAELTGWAKKKWEETAQKLERAKRWASQAWEKAKERAAEAKRKLGQKWEDIKAKARAARDAVRRKLQGARDWVRSTLKKGKEKIVETAKETWEAIRELDCNKLVEIGTRFDPVQHLLRAVPILAKCRVAASQGFYCSIPDAVKELGRLGVGVAKAAWANKGKCLTAGVATTAMLAPGAGTVMCGLYYHAKPGMVKLGRCIQQLYNAKEFWKELAAMFKKPGEQKSLRDSLITAACNFVGSLALDVVLTLATEGAALPATISKWLKFSIPGAALVTGTKLPAAVSARRNIGLAMKIIQHAPQCQ